jgi:restriction endonuclease S subunit
MAKTIVLEVENPHFTIRLYNDLLKIDLMGSFKNELEEALENKPVLKETIGRILGIFVPLHIRISEIKSVHMDETGKIEVSLSHHRNIVIPFEHKEDAEKLVEKLNQLISKAEKEKIQVSKARRRAEKEKIQVSKVRSRAERKRYRKRSDAERRV